MNNFFRLIRPVNLLIIAFTMIGLAFYLDQLIEQTGDESSLYSLNFFLLTISTVIIAASGNIINDYFDVKADRVNRPERLVVGKFIKRRVAILLHWILNLVAFGIAVYLSYKMSSFWYLFIHLLSINLLWYYSVQLKRTTVIGNVVIAILTALVPILVGIFYAQIYDWENIQSLFPFVSQEVKYFPVYLGVGLGLFAFFLNWTRELVKDIEDIKGDKVLKAKTFPIVYGVKKSKVLSYLILLMPVLISVFYFFLKRKTIVNEFSSYLPLLLAGVLMLLVYFLIARAKSPAQFRKAHLVIKIIMIIGFLLPVYWGILILL